MKDYIVMQKPSMMAIGIECRTSNHPNAAPYDIPKHWERFYSQNILSEIPNKVSDEVIALYCDYEGDYTQPYSLLIGCLATSLNEIPEGMVTKIIPASSYAVFQATGEYPNSVLEAWKNIWETRLLRTYTGDYEMYDAKFNPDTHQKVDIFIAIQPSRIEK